MQHSNIKDINNPYKVLSLNESECSIKNVEDAYKKAREEIDKEFSGSSNEKTFELKKLEKAFQDIVEKLEPHLNVEEDSDETLSISLMPGFDTKTEVSFRKEVNFSLKEFSPEKKTVQTEPFEQVKTYSLTKRICGITEESTLEEIRKLASEATP